MKTYSFILAHSVSCLKDKKKVFDISPRGLHKAGTESLLHSITSRSSQILRHPSCEDTLRDLLTLVQKAFSICSSFLLPNNL